MKILFICGSLNPGHDGVGDYTRKLAGALQAKGVEVRIIALCDTAQSEVQQENQNSDGQNIHVVRLGIPLSNAQRRDTLHRITTDFDPDWISLQYVPYAFSPKGIPFALSEVLKIKNARAKWHFMIHEAYVWHNLNFKRKTLSKIQGYILQKLFKERKPEVVHTTIPFYQSLLSKISIPSRVLGLFGNIPIGNTASQIEKSSILQGLYFGAGPLAEGFSIFSEGVKSLYINNPQEIRVVICGRGDFRTTDFIEYLKNEWKETEITIVEMGALEKNELTELFGISHFGISREAPKLIGKSGTAISMLEHGLPLWVPLAENEDEILENFDFRVEQCFANLNEINRVDLKKGFEPESRLNQISKQFLESLRI